MDNPQDDKMQSKHQIPYFPEASKEKPHWSEFDFENLIIQSNKAHWSRFNVKLCLK